MAAPVPPKPVRRTSLAAAGQEDGALGAVMAALGITVSITVTTVDPDRSDRVNIRRHLCSDVLLDDDSRLVVHGRRVSVR
jgi:hypothetical protein